jgi:hypothetical protein
MREGGAMESTKAEDRGSEDGRRPVFDCDLSAKNGSDEMCIREYLRTHIPVLV